MRIMQPRTGFALVGAALLATGVTSMALAAQNQAAQPSCYSTCPPEVTLKETYHVLHPGSEQIEDFFVTVSAGFVGADSVPMGEVNIDANGKVLCTITLTKDNATESSGSCSPSANALPDGHYVVVADYLGSGSYSSADSHPRQLQVNSPGGFND